MTLEPRALARAVVVASGLATCALAVQAQTIYRCGNEYTRIPCANGRALESSDTRTAAQRAEGRALLIRERRQAADMEKTRRREEAALKPAAAASLSPARAPEAAASAASAPKKTNAKKKTGKSKRADDGDFVAGVPPAPNPKKAPAP